MKSLWETYKNKKILVTGNTGFKGSWLIAWLLEMGADVYGLSNNIPTKPSHFDVAGLKQRIHYFEQDVRDLEGVTTIVDKIRPDFVFHLAAQPLVRLSYQDPITTLHTNIMGTAHILEALRLVGQPCTAIMITSDKCYDNVEWTWGYRETDPIGGRDPYSASKGAAELVIKTYAQSYFASDSSPVKVAVGRAGNVIGGADWALDRIVPDCMSSWSQKKTVEIRNPGATRPWQHVLEPLGGYLLLGANLSNNALLNGEAYNFGPPSNQNYTVETLINEMGLHWDNIKWKDVSQKEDHVHEAGLLKLCCDKALHSLRWEPVLNFQETVKFTVDWYRSFYENQSGDIYSLTIKQVREYLAAAEKRTEWTQF
jgi:CDP-glucose 4,6-dehydratase